LFCAALEIAERLASASDTIPLKTSKQKTEKTRLDILLVERGLAETRQKAQAMLLAGEVRVNGQRADKAGVRVSAGALVEVVGDRPRYASRGGIKLEGALQDFGVSVSGKICLDVGSSTGGFTDCLLQNGAARVFALDVSPEQLAWKLQ
jgi:23S rRNA (cytidine1920-2'-O)/16S rRNA (cytidine1409-2'-O)-methyltransferase